MSTAGYVQEGKYQKRHCATFSLLVFVTVLMFMVVGAGLGLMGWYLVTNRDTDIYGNAASDPHSLGDGSYVIDPAQVDTTRDGQNKDGDDKNVNYNNIDGDRHDETTTERTTMIKTTIPPVAEIRYDVIEHARTTEHVTTPPTTTTAAQSGVTDAELTTIIGRLWDSTSNAQFVLNRDYTLSFQDQTNMSDSQDRAPRKLFHRMSADIRGSRILKKFVRLLKSYSAIWTESDPDVEEYVSDVNRLLELISDTEAWSILREFLIEKALVERPDDLLASVWASLYTNSEGQQTNGFQRVLAGQVVSGHLIGPHNWIQFYLEEKQLNLDYQGYINKHEVGVIEVRFSWAGNAAHRSTFFMGTSPEFDMTLYTLCLVARTNTQCNFDLLGNALTVLTRDVTDSPGFQLEDAHPVL